MGRVAHPRELCMRLKICFSFWLSSLVLFSATSFAQPAQPGSQPPPPPPAMGSSSSTITFPPSQAATTHAPVSTPSGPVVLSGSTPAPPPGAQPQAPSFHPNVTNAIPTPQGSSNALPSQLNSPAGPPYNSGLQSNPTTFPSARTNPSGPETSPNIAPSEVVTVVVPPVEDAKTRKRVEAVVRTSIGNFTILLHRRYAPRTVENFMELVKGTKEFIDAKTGRKATRPFFNGLIFHRVIKNFIVQGGCPFGTGKGGPGFALADEFSPSLRHNKPGMVVMASAGQPNTNGSQFFITMGPQPDFDDKYTIFGEVTKGMDIVRAINRVRVTPTDRPAKRDLHYCDRYC